MIMIGGAQQGRFVKLRIHCAVTARGAGMVPKRAEACQTHAVCAPAILASCGLLIDLVAKPVPGQCRDSALSRTGQQLGGSFL